MSPFAPGGTSGRRSRAVTALLVLCAVTGALVGGLVAFGAVAVLVPEPWVFVTAGVLVFLALDLAAVAGVAAARVPPARRDTARAVLFGTSAAAVLLLFVVTALVPPTRAGPSSGTVLPGGQQVVLSTGSRLAVWRRPARGPVRRAPIVVLHGGPGIPDLAADAAVLAPLTGLGSDVYLYAQLGTGTSSRLDDPRGYGRDRDVADLEALRARLGLDRMILVGHSYGATVAAAYAAGHPGHVDRMVLVSPGPIDPADTSANRATASLPANRKWQLYRQTLSVRPLLGYALLQVAPAAAHAFFPDPEADARNDAVVANAEPALFCPGTPRWLPPVRDTGFYAMQYPQSASAPTPVDIRPRLTGSSVPTLIVKGACDYLSWHSALEYRDRLPRARLLYLPDAGHNLQQERPVRFRAAVAAFLAGREVPGELGPDARAVPADYRGPP